MSDKYQPLRDAIAAGPTPGPWEASYDKGSTRDIITQTEKYPVCMVRGITYVGQAQYLANAAHIAACDPDTIAALLRERDALRELVSAIMDNRGKCFIPTLGTDTPDALLNWDERARAALADGGGRPLPE